MTSRSLPILALVALCVGCNGDDSPSTPQDQTPIPTQPGVPDGDPNGALIGPDGGSLASSDALFTIQIPAGALAADTQIGIQPITNTAWGGLGKSYRLTPNGLAFATPVDLVFTVPESTMSSTAPAFLEVAVQDDAGLWYVLKNRSFDAGYGTLTATTTHFSDYSAIAGAQIEPAEATVETGKKVNLLVRSCIFQSFTADPDNLVALVASCDNDLTPLETLKNWSVNGTHGGDIGVGVVLEDGSPYKAIYTAPLTVPSSNPVAVSVETNFEGKQALLVSNITVTDKERWAGTSVFVDGNGTTVTASITWTYSETNGSLVNYVPSGSVVYQKTHEGDCPVTGITPNQHPIVNNDGFLSIDVSATPNLWSSAAALVWPATQCIQCSYDEVPRCSETYIGGQLTAGSGEVSQDGNTITDTIDFGGGATLTYTFTKQVP